MEQNNAPPQRYNLLTMLSRSNSCIVSWVYFYSVKAVMENVETPFFLDTGP